jgi:acyl-CoA reductase-like NAD-dependent aldehyde dehydrogenase
MIQHRVELIIDNEAVSTDKYGEVRDPGRFADVVGLAAQADAQHVDRAVRSAHRALAGWRETPLEARLERLEAIACLLERQAPGLVPLVVGETGMLPGEIAAEVAGSSFAVRDNIEAARAFLPAREFEDPSSWVSVEKRPVGVIAAFVPWNAPIVLMMRKLAPALACGNTIVVKTPPTAPLGLGQLLKEVAALLPPGVVNVLHGAEAVGAALVAHRLVRKISFTGGGHAAAAIMAAAAETMKGVQFELGGNDAAIVLDDCDLERAMPQLVAGTFHRSGQFCFAIKRIYVPDAMRDRFFDAMAAEVDRFRIGHPTDARTTFGPVNNRRQFDLVRALGERARRSGAEVVELGTAIDPASWDGGYFLRPALVRGVQQDAEIVACEQFGPIVPILTYRDEDEAVRLANATEFGLGSSLWSSDADRARALAGRLEAGMTFINRNAQSRLGRRHMPFGGIKQSGIGTENSELGLADYVEYHAINVHR